MLIGSLMIFLVNPRVLAIFIVVQLTCSTKNSPKLSRQNLESIINHVNTAEAHWQAGHNFDEIDQDIVQQLLGTEHVIDDSPHETKIEHIFDHHPRMMPEEMKHMKEFDGTKEWHKCASVRNVKNQGKCASDWVLAPVSAIEDRICIYKNGTATELSTHEPLSCCKTCGWGCLKGYPQMVYKQYITKGLVTGGEYGSKKGCQPYEIKPCKGNFKSCFFQSSYQTPKCKPYCYNSKYKKKYTQDRNKGDIAFKIGCPFCAAGEMTRHGPLTAVMKVYEDFLTYKSGVYHHVTGKPLGFLTVKIVGFNDTAKPSYWMAMNSWGKEWGDKGMFKIRRAVQECMFEGSIRGILVKEVPDKSSEEDSD